MLLFSKDGVLERCDDKTNIALCFDVPENIDELNIKYTYSPKTVEAPETILRESLKKYGENEDDFEKFLPVNNLITLSFDSPKGYRGACHRQSNNQNIVIGENSTAGILDGKTESGKWSVTLNVHFIGCKVNYHIEIAGVKK